MAFTTFYSINLKKDSGVLPFDELWVVDVFARPATVAAGATAPSVATGPLGATGTASALFNKGDNAGAGFADTLSALQRAILYIENDRKLGKSVLESLWEGTSDG